MSHRRLGPTALTALLAGACVAGLAFPPVASVATPTLRAGAASRPHPAQFTAGRVTNEWFPLKPGTRMVYVGVKDGKRLRDTFLTLDKTRKIQGVTCRAVRDLSYLDGALEERTTDWYAQQKKSGAVWYFGERTAELDRHGHVTTHEGSWLAGRNGAQAGVYITGDPRLGQTRRQEFYRGHAEDHFRVLDTSASVAVPLLASQNAVLTKEWTPLEPGVVDHKYYVRDIGVVQETSVSGPKESAHLVAMSHAR